MFFLAGVGFITLVVFGITFSVWLFLIIINIALHWNDPTFSEIVREVHRKYYNDFFS